MNYLRKLLRMTILIINRDYVPSKRGQRINSTAATKEALWAENNKNTLKANKVVVMTHLLQSNNSTSVARVANDNDGILSQANMWHQY